jgi:hypothetical protein
MNLCLYSPVNGSKMGNRREWWTLVRFLGGAPKLEGVCLSAFPSVIALIRREWMDAGHIFSAYPRTHSKLARHFPFVACIHCTYGIMRSVGTWDLAVASKRLQN